MDRENSNFVSVFDVVKPSFRSESNKGSSQKRSDLILVKLRKKSKPCPFCFGTDLRFEFNKNYGHGDSGFENARIICDKCSGSKGDGSGHGDPSDEDEIKAWRQWNRRKAVQVLNEKNDIN